MLVSVVINARIEKPLSLATIIKSSQLNRIRQGCGERNFAAILARHAEWQLPAIQCFAGPPFAGHAAGSSLSTVEVKKAKSANSAKLPVTVPSCLPPIVASGASENIDHSLYAQDIELAIKRITRGDHEYSGSKHP